MNIEYEVEKNTVFVNQTRRMNISNEYAVENALIINIIKLFCTKLKAYTVFKYA